MQRSIARRVLDCHDLVIATVKAREVVEAQGLAIHQVLPLVITHHFAGRDVPGCHIMSGGALNRHPCKKSGHQIDPSLVGKQSIGNFSTTKIEHAVRPPCGKSARFIGIGHADEAQVVDPVPEAANLIVHNGRDRLLRADLVWRQGDVGLIKRCQNII